MNGNEQKICQPIWWVHGTHGVSGDQRFCQNFWLGDSALSRGDVPVRPHRNFCALLKLVENGQVWNTADGRNCNSRYDFCQGISVFVLFLLLFVASDFMIRSKIGPPRLSCIDTLKEGKIHHSPEIFFFPLNSRKAWMLEITASSARDFIGITGRNNNHSCNLRGVRLIAAL